MSFASAAGMYRRALNTLEVIVSVIVIEFVTLDGIVSDPDGRGGTPAGGWAFRHGPQEVAGDKFQLGKILDEGVLLLGRSTWELFSGLWPARDTPFAARMNAVSKLVATRTYLDTSAWANSQVAARCHHRRKPERGPRSRCRGPGGRVPAADVPDRSWHGGAPVPGRPSACLPGVPVGRADRSSGPDKVRADAAVTFGCGVRALG
jgi:hypothetical protein